MCVKVEAIDGLLNIVWQDTDIVSERLSRQSKPTSRFIDSPR